EASLTGETLQASVKRGLKELLLSGTTCIMDMGTLRHTEVIAEELNRSGIRAYFGKCLMDLNQFFPQLSESKDDSLKESIQLAKRWHQKSGRIRYALTPRFILSCTDELMKQAFKLLLEFPLSLYHTHA